MTTDPIRLLFGSDFHFGIPTINQEDMAIAFADTIFPLLPETDIFFINGDFFDTLVIFDNHGFDSIYDTILKLFSLCDQYKVTLRILQGTWMHDRNQLKRFKAFYRNNHYSFDYRFVDGIDLECITVRDRSLRCMFVPDDLPFKSSTEIVKVIEDKLVEKGWDFIDYGCMHGFFDFTFPKNVSQEKVVVFSEAQFPFVKKMIDVGHVHQHRISENVISNGSFDRLCFGDEDPKGLIKVLDYPDHYTAQFIENKDAAVFDTLYFSMDDTTETIRNKIDSHLKSISTNRKIHLRCVIDNIDHRDAIKTWMREIYPDVYCKLKQNIDKEDKPPILNTSILFTPIEKRISPTPKTISTFIRNHIPEEYALTVEQIDAYLESAS